MCFSNFFKRALLAGLVAGLVAACGGGGGSSPAPTPTPTPTAANALAVTVDLGPTGNSANSLFTTVKVCQPGSTTNCQTIDHVLVDTGSTGLRLLSSVLPPTLGLSRQTTGAAGLPVLNCVKFVDGSFMWGPVASADVVLSGKTASNVPIQLIGDPAYNSLSATCQTGTPMNTVATLGANGVLGVGLFLQDCGSSSCATNPGNGYYFTCRDTSCKTTTGVTVTQANQLQNPVAMFASDNNGLLIDLPPVTSGAASLSGSMIFGVATQTNNQLTMGGTVLKTDAVGNITTLLQGVSMPNSFIDSGSNGLYFNSNAIAQCTTNPNASGFGFYCPGARTSYSATMSVTAPTPVPVPFSVDNAVTLFSNASWSVFPTLAGPSGDSTSFDWGLPFFYGKRVFIGFEGQKSALGSGTYFAF